MVVRKRRLLVRWIAFACLAGTTIVAFQVVGLVKQATSRIPNDPLPFDSKAWQMESNGSYPGSGAYRLQMVASARQEIEGKQITFILNLLGRPDWIKTPSTVSKKSGELVDDLNSGCVIGYTLDPHEEFGLAISFSRKSQFSERFETFWDEPFDHKNYRKYHERSK
jgi:hypothetical protein